MLSPRNDIVLLCIIHRNTILLQSLSSKTHKYYIGFAVLPLSKTGSQIVESGRGLLPSKIKAI
jgi:uncharacterized membrane protein (GlpM family)